MKFKKICAKPSFCGTYRNDEVRNEKFIVSRITFRFEQKT